MGISNLTSSIRAHSDISIKGLKTLEASSITTNELSLQNIPPLRTLSETSILAVEDQIRNKVLSIDRPILSFSANHTNIRAKRWLRYNGITGSNVSGYRFIRKATITGLTIQARYTSTGTFELIERTDATTVLITTATVISNSSKIIDDLNLDIERGSVIEVKIISGEFSYPTFSVEFAWRE